MKVRTALRHTAGRAVSGRRARPWPDTPACSAHGRASVIRRPGS